MSSPASPSHFALFESFRPFWARALGGCGGPFTVQANPHCRGCVAANESILQGLSQEMDPETRATITRIIQGCVYGDLATVVPGGGAPRVRPVCAFLQDDLTLLVPTHSKTRTVAEIAACAEVEICFVDSEHWQVRVAGIAQVEESADVKRRLMETTLSPKLWHGFFPDGAEDARFILYRICPRSFEWMKEWELSYRRVDVPS